MTFPATLGIAHSCCGAKFASRENNPIERRETLEDGKIR